MEVPSRKAVTESIISTDDPRQLFALGMVLVMIGCAKQKETMQESINYWRKLHGDLNLMLRAGENQLQRCWDQFRQW